MRVSQKMLIGNLTEKIHKNQNQYLSSQEKLSTGRKVNRPSDNPISTEKIMHITKEEYDFEQFEENIRYTKDVYNTMENELSRGVSILESMRELATSMSNDTMSEKDSRDAIASVDEAIDEMLNIANSKHGNVYLFSGTTYNIRPIDENTYQYNGNNEVREVEIYKDLKIAQNIPGSDIFTADNNGQINVFTALEDFKTALANNDSQNIRHALTTLEDSREQLQKNINIIGHYSTKLDITENIITENSLVNSTAKADLEDVDIAEESSNLSKFQQILEANYTLVGKTQNLTLLKYLQ